MRRTRPGPHRKTRGGNQTISRSKLNRAGDETSRGLRPHLIVAMRILLPVVALCLFSAPVQAGSVGEFRDSIERDSDNDRRGSGPSSRDGGYDDGDDDTSEILGDLIGAILSDANRRGNGSGRLRGHRFNWGETPYQGRGFMQDRTLASTTDVSVSHRQRPGHFIGRLETLGLLNGSGVGGCGVFAKIEGARTPGVVLHHQQVVDVALGERVGLTELALQPRIVTDRAVSIFGRSQESSTEAKTASSTATSRSGLVRRLRRCDRSWWKPSSAYRP